MSRILSLLFVLLIMISSSYYNHRSQYIMGMVYASDSKKEIYKTGSQKIKKNDKKVVLTMNKVIDYIINNNSDVRKILLDFEKASSDLISYRSRYDYNIYSNGNFSSQENPNDTNRILRGKITEIGKLNFGIEKTFSTGTTINAGIAGLYQNIEGAGSRYFDIGGKGYQTGIKVELKQELLKNFFGYSDRLSESKLINSEKINKESLKYKLANLLVEGLIAYWNMALAKENLETYRINLKSTTEIRNLISRKMRIGLSEREDILDWNGKVIQSRNVFERAKKILFDAKLNLIRTLNLDGEFNLEIAESFSTEKPDIGYERALRDAFLYRVDWNNYLILLKNAQLEYKIASSQLMPSLKLTLSLGNQDYDPRFRESYNSINKEYSIGFEMLHPLENRHAEVRMRNAILDLKKIKLDAELLEKSIKDEILSLVKQCDLDYRIYKETQKSGLYAKKYYYQVLNKFQKARYSALQLKAALDGFILSRQEGLKALIDYNITLLKRDFAMNTIFKNLGIAIDKILKAHKSE